MLGTNNKKEKRFLSRFSLFEIGIIYFGILSNGASSGFRVNCWNKIEFD